MPRADYQGRLLRSAINYPDDVLLKVLYSLEPKDFSNEFYRKVFIALREIAQTGDNDTVTLIDALSQRELNVELLLKEGGVTYSSNNIDEPIKTVKNRARLNALQNLHTHWVDITAKADTDSQQHITRVMAAISKLYNKEATKNISQGIDSMLEQAERYKGREYFGLQTGLKDMDWITRGMQKQHLWLLGGYTSVGKSWFGVHMAQQHIEAGLNTLYMSFEMSMEELLWRLTTKIVDDPDVTLNKAKSQNLPQKKLDTVFETIEALRDAPLTIIDHISLWDETRLHLLHHIYAENVDCIIIDYLQNIVASSSKSEYESLNLIVRELQRFAVQHDVFIMALSQISRDAQKNESDKVFGFKGSGNLENAADVAITVRDYGETPEEREIMREVVVGKNRTGDTGRFTVDVDFSRGMIEND